MSGELELDAHLPSRSDGDDFMARSVAVPLRKHRPDVSEPLLEILAELLDNAMTHGDSPAGTRFRLRAGATKVVATVVDHGIGIRAHLARAGVATESDVEAIEVAVREGTTGAYEPRGYGLPDSIETLRRMAPARMTIRSGAGQGSFEASGDRSFSEVGARIVGTVITRSGPRRCHPDERDDVSPRHRDRCDPATG